MLFCKISAMSCLFRCSCVSTWTDSFSIAFHSLDDSEGSEMESGVTRSEDEFEDEEDEIEFEGEGRDGTTVAVMGTRDEGEVEVLSWVGCIW